MKQRKTSAAMAKEPDFQKDDQVSHGRWYGSAFCPINGESPIDGCYYCGRAVAPGSHDHTEVEKGRYSCVCPNC